MKPRMKKIMMGIMVIGMANTVPAEASLLKWAGTVLENAVKRRIGNEVDSTVNATFDTAKESIKGEAGTVTPAGVTAGEHVTGKKSSTNQRGKALRYTGKYETIDLRGMMFTGEEVYAKELLMGNTHIEVDEFLDPGFYLIWVHPKSEKPIRLVGKNQSEGIFYGYGVNIVKTIFNNNNGNMNRRKDGVMEIVQVEPGTQGRLQVAVMNDLSKMGTGHIMIYKIPGPTLK